MTLSWDADDERVVIEVFPFSEAGRGRRGDRATTPSRSREPEEVLLVRIAAGAARAFAQRAERVVAAGPPPCPFCGGPIDPDGHLCLRANGFRRRDA